MSDFSNYKVVTIAVALLDGEIRYVEIKTNLTELGNKRLVQAIFRDVSERKKAEEALQERERQFRELNELLPEVIFEIDTKGYITFVNRVAFDLFGFSEADLKKGLNLIEMLTPDAQKRARKNFRKILIGEKLGEQEKRA